MLCSQFLLLLLKLGGLLSHGFLMFLLQEGDLRFQLSFVVLKLLGLAFILFFELLRQLFIYT